MSIGFIGQGFIGKNYADDFENRGYSVVRYALEEPYCHNKDDLKHCDVIFIAVPTPSKPADTAEQTVQFDDRAVQSALQLVPEGATAVIKSTLQPGTTERLQKQHPNIYVFHSPEFLREAHAAYDAAHPKRTIVGVPGDEHAVSERAREVLALLPDAPFKRITGAREAELIKNAGNAFLYTKVIFMNLLYDYAQANDIDFDTVADAMKADERIGASHMQPVHQSGHPGAKPGRGAGGHCFIKDLASFIEAYRQQTDDQTGLAILEALVEKNKELLTNSEKDLDLLEEVYGQGMSQYTNDPNTTNNY
jgi:UDPglucose 6-dehydrogenase